MRFEKDVSPATVSPLTRLVGPNTEGETPMKKLLLGFLFVACSLYVIPAPGRCAEPYAGPDIALKPEIHSPPTKVINCIWRIGGEMWCKDKDISEIEPVYYEDMAVCGEPMSQYRLMSSRSDSEYKERLNKAVPARRAELKKWAWLKPTKKDLALISELLGCHRGSEIDAVLTESGYVSRKPTTQFERTTTRLVLNEYELHKERKYTSFVVRPVNRFFLEKNQGDTMISNKIVWFTIDFVQSIYMHSEEYWINCSTPGVKLQSDYYDKDFNGWTLPGKYTKWDEISNNSFEERVLNELCPYIK